MMLIKKVNTKLTKKSYAIAMRLCHSTKLKVYKIEKAQFFSVSFRSCTTLQLIAGIEYSLHLQPHGMV